MHLWQVSGTDRQRHPPPPLSTLEMQKKATTSLRISGDRVMKLAEELYQTGFISYPRTETDTFDAGYDLMVSLALMYFWPVDMNYRVLSNRA